MEPRGLDGTRQTTHARSENGNPSRRLVFPRLGGGWGGGVFFLYYSFWKTRIVVLSMPSGFVGGIIFKEGGEKVCSAFFGLWDSFVYTYAKRNPLLTNRSPIQPTTEAVICLSCLGSMHLAKTRDGEELCQPLPKNRVALAAYCRYLASSLKKPPKKRKKEDS